MQQVQHHGNSHVPGGYILVKSQKGYLRSLLFFISKVPFVFLVKWNMQLCKMSNKKHYSAHKQQCKHDSMHRHITYQLLLYYCSRTSQKNLGLVTLQSSCSLSLGKVNLCLVFKQQYRFFILQTPQISYCNIVNIVCLGVCRRVLHKIFNPFDVVIRSINFYYRSGRSQPCHKLVIEINLHINCSVPPSFEMKTDKKLCVNSAIVLRLTSEIGDFTPKWSYYCL